MPLKTVQIQEAILQHFYEKQHPYCCSNFSGAGYEEMDVITVTRGRLVQEFEVKVSRSDFRADFKKTTKHWYYSKGLFGDHCQVPNRFYYACPPGLIKIEEVPVYAGLVYVSGYTLQRENEVHTTLEIVKKAPFIHKENCQDKLIFRICQTLTARSIYGCALMTFKNRRTKEFYEKLNA